MIVLRWSYRKNRNIVTEVIQSPQKYPIILLVSDIEVFSIKNIDIGEFTAVIEGKLVIIGKLLKFFKANIPCMRL